MKKVIKFAAVALAIGAAFQAVVAFAYETGGSESGISDPQLLRERLRILIPNEDVLDQVEAMAEENPALRKNLDGFLKQMESMSAVAGSAEPGP